MLLLVLQLDLFRFTVKVLLLLRLRHGQATPHVDRLSSGRLLVAVDPLDMLLLLVLLLFAAESCIELCN